MTDPNDHDLLLALDGNVRVASATVAALSESVDQRFAARDLAVKLQATEYERRLDNLNHEHERLAADRVAFASNERVDGAIRELVGRFDPKIALNADSIAALQLSVVNAKTYEERHLALSDRVGVLEGFRARAVGFGALLALLSGAIGAAIGRALG